jgi:Zn-dependent alcohol dehydrogenase
VASGKIDLDPFITSVNNLPQIGAAFENMDGNAAGMKALLSCGHSNIS